MRKPTIQAFMVVASVVASVVVGGVVCGREAAAQDARQEVFVFKRQIDGAAPGVDVTFTRPAPPPHELGLIAVEPFEAARPVGDAPYTAEAVTEVTQALADGNRIERRTSAAIARDSRGRVRREHQGMMLGALQAAPSQIPLVSIADPTSGTHVTLNQERRVAHRISMPTFDIPVRTRVGDVIISAGGGLKEVPLGLSPNDAGGANVRTEQLGEQEIEGVRAEGTRTTMTVPVGAIGNQLPIHTVSERWYSPELQVVVLTRRSDPRFGDTVYRLTNIVRAEPPPDLFEVPPDYQVENVTPGQRVAPPGR